MSETLLQFLDRHRISRYRCSEYASGFHSDNILYLASKIAIHPVQKKERVAIPSQLIADTSRSHSEFINDVILHLSRNSIRNVINIGYNAGEDTGVSSHLTCPGKNMAVLLLKSPEMEIISNLLTREIFLDLILNYHGCDKYQNLQVFGPSSIKKYSRSFNNKRSVNIGRLLYTEICSLPKLNPISPKLRDNLKAMFPCEFKSARKNTPKRMRKLVKLCEILMYNHVKMQPNYSYIMDNCCPKKKEHADNFDAATDKKDVIRLVIIIFEKIFPHELYGSTSNKVSLFKIISLLVYSKRFESYDSSQLVKKFKLLDLEWLKPRGEKLNKQEFIKLQTLFKEFLVWFIETFLVKLISAYFHVTELSQSKELLYFRHDVWRSILKSHKDRYFNKYLSVVPKARNDLLLFRLNEHHIGRLRFIPKKNDFRAIVVPFKGPSWERFYHASFLKNIIRPALSVLSSKREVDDMSKSNIDMSQMLHSYRTVLLESYGHIPSVFALKFDVKSCYDSIPTKKVLEIIKGLMDSNEHFISRDLLRIPSSGEKGNVFKKREQYQDTDLRFLIVGKKQCGSYLARQDKAVDSTNNISLTAKQVLQIVEDQISKSAIYSRGETYVRKDGVFQGFHMSSMFCNFLYDELAARLSEWTGMHESTKIIRIADDFLFLTADFDSAKKLKKIINRPIEAFNVNVNRTKTWCNFDLKDSQFVAKSGNSDVLEFCKLEIDLRDLTVMKKFETYEIGSIQALDFNKLYKKCLVVYGRRLKFSLFIVKLSSVDKVLENLAALLRAIYTKYVASCRLLDRRGKENVSEFYKAFHLPLLKMTFKRFESMKEISNHQLYEMIMKSMVECLGSNKSRFKDNIDKVIEKQPDLRRYIQRKSKDEQ